VVRPETTEPELVRAWQDIAQSVDGLPYVFDRQIVEGNSVVEAILQVAENYDLIVIGATNEPLFKNLLMGNIPEQVAVRAKVTTIMVKRRHSPVKSLLRELILQPNSAVRNI
jgi:nucleotide-binding universal stress UspA family protein